MTRIVSLEINLGGVQSAPQLHDVLATALDFPGWYGRNWDALWDAITGLVDMPHTLRFLGWTDFAVRLPDEAQTLRRLFGEMSLRLPMLASAVIYV